MRSADYIVVNLTPDGSGQFWNDDIEDNTPEAVKSYLEHCRKRENGMHATASRFLVGERALTGAGGDHAAIRAVTARVYEVQVETIPERVIPERTVVHVRVA